MKRFFTEKQLAASAILGGPIPPGILFYLNYKKIGKDKEAYISMVLTLLFSVALFSTLLNLPESIVDRIPNFVFTAFYGLLVYLFYHKFLGKEIQGQLDSGGTIETNWKVAGYTILGLGINILIIFSIALSIPPFEGDKLTFGKTNNEIYFDKTITSVSDVNKLAAELSATGFFSDEYAVAVHLDTWETKYVVTVQIDKSYWNDSEVLTFLNGLKENLKSLYARDVTIILEHFDLSGKRSEKLI